jgi:uncharacterized Zn-binding protein involved in type VI secretion
MAVQSVGEEGFRWFIGVVEDRDDPLKQGRVRVRIYNVHGDIVETPKNTLPFAVVLMPGFSASLNQVGVSATGLQIGSTVVGFFMDGNDTMMPVIFGVMPGQNDMPKLAAGQSTINKQLLGPEPANAFNARYPYNKVTKTESGHVIEIDDTPNFERLHTYHKSGTYSEIDHTGQRVNRIVGDDYEIVERNKTIYINGNVNINVKGSYSLNVDGPISINGSTVNINNGTQGAARVGDTADTQDNGDLEGTNIIQTGSNTVVIGG